MSVDNHAEVFKMLDELAAKSQSPPPEHVTVERILDRHNAFINDLQKKVAELEQRISQGPCVECGGWNQRNPDDYKCFNCRGL